MFNLSNLLCRRSYSRRIYFGAILATCMAGFGLVTANADMMEEVHEYSHSIENPQFGYSYGGDIAVRRFDTMGGTRELVGYRTDYELTANFTAVVQDNPTGDWVGAQVSCNITWSAGQGSQSVFPYDIEQMYNGFGFATQRPPLCQGDVYDRGAGSGHGETVTDPAMLEWFSSDGYSEAWLESAFNLSTLTVEEVDHPDPEDYVFDPTLIDFSIYEMRIDITHTYCYTPEPGTLALLGLASLAVARRRKL